MATVRAGFRRLGLYDYLDGFKEKGVSLSYAIELMCVHQLDGGSSMNCSLPDSHLVEGEPCHGQVFSRNTLGFSDWFSIDREGFFDRKNNRLSGLIGIVLPEMGKEIFLEKSVCEHCGSTMETVCVDDSTVLREFRENYWLVKNGCGHYSGDGRFCILVRYSEFMDKGKAEEYIEAAFRRPRPI